MTSAEILKKYLGVPYRHMGREIASGLDCWGLIKSIYADAGLIVTDVENYAVGWSRDGEDYFDAAKYPEWTRVQSPEFLDVVLFRNSDDISNHAGLVMDKGRFIHCCRAGVVVSRLGDIQWFKRMSGLFRLRTHD